jgi:hypothetical protein
MCPIRAQQAEDWPARRPNFDPPGFGDLHRRISASRLRRPCRPSRWRMLTAPVHPRRAGVSIQRPSLGEHSRGTDGMAVATTAEQHRGAISRRMKAHIAA